MVQVLLVFVEHSCSGLFLQLFLQLVSLVLNGVPGLSCHALLHHWWMSVVVRCHTPTVVEHSGHRHVADLDQLLIDQGHFI